MIGRLLALACFSLALGAGCQLVLSSDSPWPDDADASAVDASSDAGQLVDAGEPADAGEPNDAGAVDAGEPDAGAPCGQPGDTCSESQECCEGSGCRATIGSCEALAEPGLEDGFRCKSAGECNNGYCRDGICADPGDYSCRGAASLCGEDKPCCSGTFCHDDFPASCVVGNGAPCLESMMCNSRNCGDDGRCASECRAEGAGCIDDHSCCSGNCSAEGLCVPCIGLGLPCEEYFHVTCCSKSCWSGACAE